MGAVSENAVAFSVNQQLKRFIKQQDGEEQGLSQSLWLPFCTGGFTGIFTSVALCPADVIKCKVGGHHHLDTTGQDIAGSQPS